MKPDDSRTPGDGRKRFGHLPPDALLLTTARPIDLLLPEVLTYLGVVT